MRFAACGTPMSIRSIEMQYESDPSPLIWTLNVEQEWPPNGYKATTVFGEIMSLDARNGKTEKVCV